MGGRNSGGKGGPPKKSSAMREAEGSRSHKKKDLFKQEIVPPISNECPKPPAWLSSQAKKFWREYAPKYHKLNLLSDVHVPMWAALCENFATYKMAMIVMTLRVAKERKKAAGKNLSRLEKAEIDLSGHIETTPNGNKVYSQERCIAIKALEEFRKGAQFFGFTPSDMARLFIPAANPDDDPVAKIEKEKKSALEKIRRSMQDRRG